MFCLKIVYRKIVKHIKVFLLVLIDGYVDTKNYIDFINYILWMKKKIK